MVYTQVAPGVNVQIILLAIIIVPDNFLDMDGRYIMSIMTLIVIGYIAQLKTYSFIKTLILALSETSSPSQGYAI